MLILWTIGAVLVGAVAGLMIGRIFRWIAPSGSSRDYFSGVASSIRELVVGDESEFWTHYKHVIFSTVKYVGRQLLALFAAFAPIAVLLLLISPMIWPYWNQHGSLLAYPDGDTETVWAFAAGDSKGTLSVISETGHSLSVPSNVSSHAICTTDSWACTLLPGIGFTTSIDDALAADGASYVVVRWHRDDWNPLWPYLNDIEFLFFLSISLLSIYAIFAKGPQPAADADHFGISTMDFAMTEWATGAKSSFKKLGDTETRGAERKLADIHVEHPVFICGLARSGTTILLEKLASVDGVGTHRYRDFPFVMTPLYWHRLSAFLGSDKQAVERPHKDGIKITRESPDAFEEPIWQHFFPDSLSPLDPDNAGAEAIAAFEPFFRDHVRKILLLRDADRYVSKGNYNVLRIELLASLFPNATFLVPIRHPLPHTRSLVRQHEQFMKYAESDPRVGDYLQAVGHFEFGPQRRPLMINAQGTANTLAHWENGDDLLGYAQQWSDVYAAIHALTSASSGIADRIRVVRYEQLCADPDAEFDEILRLCDLDRRASPAELSVGIQQSRTPTGLETDVDRAIWAIVADTADRYGYTV